MDYSQFLYMHEELSLLAVILVLFIADLFMCPDKKSGKGVYNTCLPVVLLTVHTALNLLPCCSAVSCEAFGGMYLYTPMMTIMKSVLNVGTLIVCLMAHKWLSREENLVKQGEFYMLVLFTLLGMYFMISSGHFLMFFIGLELASVPMTALVAFDKRRMESAEAGAKFILLALFSSALLLYGISLIYGATGTLYFDEIGALLDGSLLSIFGLVLFITGMGFKISLVPFHLWTADTYEGAPTVVTGFLSVISKGSAAFVLLTVLMKAFAQSELFYSWNTGMYWIIVASITVANLFAIRQNNLKRFMAFSAISQAGYLVLAIMDGTAQGMTSLVFYLLVYMVSNLGAFAVMTTVEENSGKINISDYDGLYQSNPKLAFLMTLCLFSLAGIPPFAGFFSKFFVFMAAFNAGYPLLVFIALANTVISLYYYLLIVKAMYIKPNESPIATFKSDGYTRLALALSLLGVIVFGLGGVFYTYIEQFSYGI
ncbi:MAG: NADH-quinone oxidoreductase subunit N [Prevotellaceae bacterium]|nr:NADH-quinone oxidoreductase subunit N [Prevotellaceae bacterium]